MARWRIEQFRGRKVEHVGTIEADSEREAIEKAITVFRIEPASRFKLVATKIETKRE